MFNLGYLPGGDKQIVTRSDTTIRALSLVLPLLSRTGALSVIAYAGHPGGMEETKAVVAWARRLDPERYSVCIAPDRALARTTAHLWIFVTPESR